MIGKLGGGFHVWVYGAGQPFLSFYPHYPFYYFRAGGQHMGVSSRNDIPRPDRYMVLVLLLLGLLPVFCSCEGRALGSPDGLLKKDKKKNYKVPEPCKSCLSHNVSGRCCALRGHDSSLFVSLCVCTPYPGSWLAGALHIVRVQRNELAVKLHFLWGT